jgi:hypothetical protein
MQAWIYFTLFSTLLPSLINLAIATASLVAWPLPGKFLAAKSSATKPMAAADC